MAEMVTLTMKHRTYQELKETLQTHKNTLSMLGIQKDFKEALISDTGKVWQVINGSLKREA